MGGAGSALKVSTGPGWKSSRRGMQALPSAFWEGWCPRRSRLLGALLRRAEGSPGRQQSLKAEPAQDSL